MKTVDNMSEQEQIARLDAMLGEANAERIARMPSLASLLGEYDPVEAHPGFYARAPKLRQQIEIARLAERSQGSETASQSLESAAELARLAIYVPDPQGEPTLASLDQVLDTFNADEITEILGKYLGLKARESEDPNGST